MGARILKVKYIKQLLCDLKAETKAQIDIIARKQENNPFLVAVESGEHRCE